MEKNRKDILLRGILRGGEARFFICSTTEMTRQAREIHSASHTCTAAMGRMISAVAMLGSGLKSDEERITVTIRGGGPAGALTAVARANGAVKVTIDHPDIELPLKPNGKLDVGGALGRNGQLSVVRSSCFGEPYVGRVALVSGEVAEDFAMYYTESEQIPSLCALGVRTGKDVECAGGILIQAMPSCSNDLLDQLDIRTELFSGISQLLFEMTPWELSEACFRGLNPEVLEECPLSLSCDCSREQIERVLLSMGRMELKDMIEKDGGCEVSCHFCRTKYHFTAKELDALLQEGTEDRYRENTELPRY